jgi:hypothetical protein
VYRDLITSKPRWEGFDGQEEAEAFLAQWAANGKQYDLNTLFAPSPLQMTGAIYVNNEGDIVGGGGVLPDGSQRAFLLGPNQSVPLPQAATTARPLASARRQPERVTDLAVALQGSDRSGIAARVRQLLLSHGR